MEIDTQYTAGGSIYWVRQRYIDILYGTLISPRIYLETIQKFFTYRDRIKIERFTIHNEGSNR